MMGAVSLNNVLQELDDIKSKTIPEDFSQRFFRRQADKIKPLWSVILTYEVLPRFNIIAFSRARNKMAGP